MSCIIDCRYIQIYTTMLIWLLCLSFIWPHNDDIFAAKSFQELVRLSLCYPVIWPTDTVFSSIEVGVSAQ